MLNTLVINNVTGKSICVASVVAIKLSQKFLRKRLGPIEHYNQMAFTPL